jgi:photosystem II stability/assembly factor-like uncharacterized protein
MKLTDLRILFLALIYLFLLQGCSNDDPGGPSVTPPDQTPKNDWTRQPIEFRVDLRDIFFFHGSLGWAVGNIESVFTSSTGELWSLVPVTEDNESVYRSVYFITESKGWMVGDLASNASKGQIAYSGIGGSYPIQQAVVDAPLNTVFFTDEETGWAAGNGGLIVYTINGGKKWTNGNMGTSDSVYCLYFTDKTKGWAVTANGGILHTYDGQNWQADSSGVTTDLKAVQFTDSIHGFICGDMNTILIGTADAGNTIQWQKISIDDEAQSMIWKDIFFIDPMYGWVIGKYDRIYKTTDGGLTWVKQSLDDAGELNSIFMVSKTKGWIAGDNGTMLTYTPRD